MNKIRNILYLGWLGKSNVGDDVLYELFKKMFYQNIDREKNNCEYNIDGFIPDEMYKWDIAEYDMVVLGGGSLFNLSYWLDLCLEAQRYNIPTISWGTGIDGFYTDKMELADTRKFFSGDCASKIKEAARKMKYISVRGPFTRDILINAGLDDTAVNEVGDPALFYELNTVAADEAERRKVLVNWGTSYNNIFGRKEEKVEEQLETALQILLNRGYKVSVYPIWTKDIASVMRLGEKFTDDNFSIISEVYDARGLARLISGFSFTINIKLHANILSAAMNRPFISLAYRGKCFDFAESVGCGDLAVSTAGAHAGMILNRVDLIEKEYDYIVKRFERAKEKYRPRLIDSFKVINKILEGQ